MSAQSAPKAQKALVTGASAGIGAVYADRLAKRGHDLILAARDGQKLEALAKTLRAQTQVNVEVLPVDLSQRAGVERLEQALREDKSIGLLVNNAGVGALGAVLGMSGDEVESLLQVNVIAAARLATAAASAFGARGGGAVINLSSVLALAHERANAIYGGSKAFLLAYTQQLQKEVEGKGVRLQAVLPGATRTEIWAKSGVDIDSLDPARVMEVGDLVDAALAGFDAGELVTIPSLPEVGDWQAFEAARQKLGPNLSRNRPASRYQASA